MQIIYLISNDFNFNNMVKITYTIKCNRAKRTYTIREYLNGKIFAKYRTYPQGADYSENWTENDIRQFLYSQTDNDCYLVKNYADERIIRNYYKNL